jgi:hypothetical protein
MLLSSKSKELLTKWWLLARKSVVSGAAFASSLVQALNLWLQNQRTTDNEPLAYEERMNEQYLLVIKLDTMGL